VAKNSSLELLERRARLDAELFDERLTQGPIRLERLRLPSGAVEGKDELGAKPLSQRVLYHESLELSGELGVAPKREIRLDSPFERREPQFFESPDRGLRERFERELCERRASPEHERLP